MIISVRERFARKVAPGAVGAHGAFGIKDYQFPTHKQMDRMEAQGLPFEIEPGVREAVIQVNEAGYCTGSSCQGHGNRLGWVGVEPHRSEVPKKLQRVYSKHAHFSAKPVDPKEIKEILVDNDLEPRRYAAANWQDKTQLSSMHIFSTRASKKND